MEINTNINSDNFSSELNTTESLKEYEYYYYFTYHDYNSVMWEKKLGFDLLAYVCPILLIFGTLGNMMSFVVFNTISMSGSVSSIFFRTLAIVDILYLYSSLPRIWVNAVFQYDIRNVHVAVCKLNTFFVYWSGHMSAWILSAVAVERVIGVSMPHRYKSLVTRRRAKIVLLTTILALAALNAYFLVFKVLRVITNDYSDKTSITCAVTSKEAFSAIVWSYIDIAVYSICPFTIICLSNICIIFFLIRASIKRKLSMANTEATDKTSNVSVILLTVSFVYLVCTVPIVVYFPVELAWWKSEVTWKRISQLDFYYTSATLLSTVINAVNLILYCLSGPSFRRALVNLFVRK